MTRVAVLLALLTLLPGAFARAAEAPAAETPPGGPETFRWTTKCSEIASARLAVCRIVADVRQGVSYRGPFVPVIFQLDNRHGRSISIGTERNCAQVPAVIRFGANPPYHLPQTDSLSGPLFDRALAEFRAAKSGTVEYAPLPSCEPVTATFYYSNFDDAMAKALAIVGE